MPSRKTRDLSLRQGLVRQALAEDRPQHAWIELNQIDRHIERRFCTNYGPVAPPPSPPAASRAVQHPPRPVKYAPRPVQHPPRPVQAPSRPVRQPAAASSSSPYSSMQNPNTNNSTQRTQPSAGRATQQPRGQNVQGTTGNPAHGNPGATAQVNAVQAQRPQHLWRAGSTEKPWGAGPWRPNGNNR